MNGEPYVGTRTMYGSPIWTLRARLRATCVNRRGAVAWTIERHMPRGKRTRWPVDVGAGVAEDLDRIREVDDLDPDLFEERVGVRPRSAPGRSVEMTSTGGSRRVRYGSVSMARARRSVWRAARPRRTAGCSRSCVAIWSPRDASGRAVGLVPAMVRRPRFQRRSASSRPSRNARLARRGATQSPMAWTAAPGRADPPPGRSPRPASRR